jgi:hypothetical protein
MPTFPVTLLELSYRTASPILLFPVARRSARESRPVARPEVLPTTINEVLTIVIARAIIVLTAIFLPRTERGLEQNK